MFLHLQSEALIKLDTIVRFIQYKCPVHSKCLLDPITKFSKVFMLGSVAGLGTEITFMIDDYSAPDMCSLHMTLPQLIFSIKYVLDSGINYIPQE